MASPVSVKTLWRRSWGERGREGNPRASRGASPTARALSRCPRELPVEKRQLDEMGIAWRWAAGALAVLGARSLVGHEQVAAASASDVDRALLAAMLDAEINATNEYVSLLKAKVSVLTSWVRSEHARQESAPGVTSSRSPHRLPSVHGSTRFDDWFSCQSTWLAPPAPDATAKKERQGVHVELVSFRPNGSLGSKRNAHAGRHGAEDPAAPITQFLLVLDLATGALDLRHPTSRAIVWQQRLRVPSPIAKVYFHSDRATHLALVTSSGRLFLYKMRVFHGRRLVAGDYRRLSGRESMSCSYITNALALNGTTPSPPTPAFLRPPMTRTAAPNGLHLHVEFEFDFHVELARNVSAVTMVASHQSLFTVTASGGGHLSVYSGHNGTFLGEISTGLGEISHFQPLPSGILAFTIANRIYFIDVFDRRVLDLSCEGSRLDFTSLERDVWRHTVLYAGTADGSGLVFRINRFGSMKRNNGLMPLGTDALPPLDDSDLGFPTCMLTASLQPRARVFSSLSVPRPLLPSIVSALPGYLLLTSSDGHLVLYETTSSSPGRPSYIGEKSVGPLLDSASQLLSVQATKDLASSSAAVAIVVVDPSQPRVRVELLASRLPLPTSGLELGWIRAPVMLFCAFGVMFWQQSRFRRSSSLDASFDFERRAFGRSGGPNWSKVAHHRAFRGR